MGVWSMYRAEIREPALVSKAAPQKACAVRGVLGENMNIEPFVLSSFTHKMKCLPTMQKDFRRRDQLS